MAYVLTEKARAVLTTLQEHKGENLTSKQLAEMTGIENRSMTAVLNAMARQTSSHGKLVYREVVEGIEGKVIYLTEDGEATDPNAEVSEKNAE